MTRSTMTDLRDMAEEGAAWLGPNATAEQVLTWAAETFGKRAVVASTMQDAVMVAMTSKIFKRVLPESVDGDPSVDVLFVDTGYHFAETIGMRDAVEATYDVRVVTVQPSLSVPEQDSLLGRNLFARDPDRCCQLRKVLPLQRALAGYDAWITGMRREETAARANAPLVSYDEKNELIKINPIAAWTGDEVEAYIDANNVLVNPLVEEGYLSIGCRTCTVKPLPGADPRSGRWAGRAKTECGLHV